jgi:RNA polymerase sigma-70 factor (sigma-E family)
MNRDDDEFDEFVLGSVDRLRRAARGITLDDGRADDLVQHALEKTYLSWGRVREDPYAYARRTMVNASIDWWRRIGRHERLVQAAPEPERRAGRDPADAAGDRAVLHQALALLTRKERAVVVLRFYDDLTEEQTARELGVALGTVKSTCHRALRKIRDGVAQQREMEGTA